MKQVSLADITFNQGLQLLVLRKQGLDSGKIRRMTKEAMDNAYPLQAIGTQMIEAVKEAGPVDDFKNSISSAGNSLQEGFDGVKGGVQNWWKGLNPPTQSTLTHGAIGAGLGAASGAGASFMGDGRHYGRNMLMGGVAGGAIGGGLGIARNPEIAESLREKFEGMLSKEEPDAPPTPEVTPAATPAKAPKSLLDDYVPEELRLPEKPDIRTPGETDTEADRVLALPDDPRKAEIDSNRDTLEEHTDRNANLAHVTNAGLTTTGLKWLSKVENYDPRVLAEYLKDNANTINPKALKEQLNLLPDQLAGKSVKQLEALIYKQKHLRHGALGLSSQVSRPNRVRSLLNLPPGSPLHGATSRGLRSARPGRLGTLLSLLAASVYGITRTEAGRAAGKATQENAKALLDVLNERMTSRGKK